MKYPKDALRVHSSSQSSAVESGEGHIGDIGSESILSFLGIGVKEPLSRWGNLAADGLSELNTVRVCWWRLLLPCVFISITLLALNFVGEALREALDPKRRSLVLRLNFA